MKLPVRGGKHGIFVPARNMANAVSGIDQFDKYTPGPGLRAWARFFPGAMVYGLDVDPMAARLVNEAGNVGGLRREGEWIRGI